MATHFSIHRIVSFIALIGLAGCVHQQMNAESPKTILISNDTMHVELAPDIGGSVLSLTWNGMDIMRRSPPNTDSVDDVAGFPMVPIVNRIPEGKFTFEGKDVDLDGNFMGLPEFIHGHGWLEAWNLISQTSNSATIRYEHAADKWPWDYTSDQVFTLLEDGLKIELSITNNSDSNMPADLGFHPYFPTNENTILTFNHEGHWLNNGWGIAVMKLPGPFRQDYRKGGTVYDVIMTDAPHYGWDGKATLSEPGRPDIVLTASEDLGNLHVFHPPLGDFIALEPQNGRSDPFNHFEHDDSYIKTLAPSETWSVWMKIQVQE